MQTLEKIFAKILKDVRRFNEDLTKILNTIEERSLYGSVLEDPRKIPQRSCWVVFVVVCQILYRSLYGSLQILLTFIKEKRRLATRIT